MTFPDLASVASAMAAAKIVEFSAGGVTIKLHPSAFEVPGQASAPQDPKAFLDMPTDEQLKFWSVEGEDEKADPAPELKKKGRRRG